MRDERETGARANDAEAARLAEDARRERNWKRWGPYLAERQWGTGREDYSADGDPWSYFPHDHARSRAYRWGEDGLLGITDRECRLCFAVAMWNGRDPFLKERLFGVSGPEGNHGEDVKEWYAYLDATPTHSYLKALYRYPWAEFPYARLVEENRRRGRGAPEFELADTGVLDGGRYFDVVAEYAKADPDDVLIRLTVANRGPEDAELHLLPTLWFRNTWSWGRGHDGSEPRPRLLRDGDRRIAVEHPSLGRWRLSIGLPAGAPAPELLFTENETHAERLFGSASEGPWVKDAFHRRIVDGDAGAVNPEGRGTKAAAHFLLRVPAGGETLVRLRLSAEEAAPAAALGAAFDRVLDQRIAEADAFYERRIPGSLSPEERAVVRQAYAGLLWSKQFYHYAVREWLDGDPAGPAPPESHRLGRNRDWVHLYNRDVVSMPDKWEYPWYASWDLAFHVIPFARIDPQFAKEQLVLFLREWYMHPNGQIPAYELALSDVNPPVHAWACWRTYKRTGPRGARDRAFLARTFQKLLLNFTWWVNRKDLSGHHLFSGGFLGLDNIGVFDRSRPLPGGARLEQADGTAWMAFFCNQMLAMALELAHGDPAYEDIASKFFEHFVAIADAMNTFGGTGLWDEEDGFYYDRVHADGFDVPLKARSLVGIIPLLTALVLEEGQIAGLPGFRKRMEWFLVHRADLERHATCMDRDLPSDRRKRLLAIPTRGRMLRVLSRLLDEREFLSPFGIRSLSKWHLEHPYSFRLDGETYGVAYEPGESETGLFGGNSNWRGPVWLPVNYLVIEALERYHHFYGDALRVECPTGSGHQLTLAEVADEISRRVASLFLPGPDGLRPCDGGDPRSARDPVWRGIVPFHEYFHADTGRGLGAGHQTGWTALVAEILDSLARRRARGGAMVSSAHAR